jgi:hypothetical protein
MVGFGLLFHNWLGWGFVVWSDWPWSSVGLRIFNSPRGRIALAPIWTSVFEDNILTCTIR